MSDELLQSVADGIGRLTINRPERRNSLSPALIEALLDALGRMDADPNVRVIVLTGAGERVFCAGADLAGALAAAGTGVDPTRRYVDLLEAMRTLGKPIIARVNGLAFGGGLGLVMASDLAVAGATAKLGTPEVKVGMFPMIIMALLFRHVGRKRGLEMIYGGEPLEAEGALAAGLLNAVVPPDELDETVAGLAKRLAAHSPAVLKLGKRAFAEMEDRPLPDAFHLLEERLRDLLSTEDAAEGIAAFIEKRPPVWKGR